MSPCPTGYCRSPVGAYCIKRRGYDFRRGTGRGRRWRWRIRWRGITRDRTGSSRLCSWQRGNKWDGAHRAHGWNRNPSATGFWIHRITTNSTNPSQNPKVLRKRANVLQTHCLIPVKKEWNQAVGVITIDLEVPSLEIKSKLTIYKCCNFCSNRWAKFWKETPWFN